MRTALLLRERRRTRKREAAGRPFRCLGSLRHWTVGAGPASAPGEGPAWPLARPSPRSARKRNIWICHRRIGSSRWMPHLKKPPVASESGRFYLDRNRAEKPKRKQQQQLQQQRHQYHQQQDQHEGGPHSRLAPTSSPTVRRESETMDNVDRGPSLFGICSSFADAHSTCSSRASDQ